MIKKIQVPIFTLTSSLTSTMDLISPIIANHHMQVAYISFRIASELNLSMMRRRSVLLAATLHDIGALSLRERVENLEFEIQNPHGHAENGSYLLRLFEPFAEVAEIVRFHHVAWQDGAGLEFRGEPVPIESHILHLADRIAVLIDTREEIFSQVPLILKTIKAQQGKMFMPQLVECFMNLSDREYFWLDIASNQTGYLPYDAQEDILVLDLNEIVLLANLFAKIIDFRSPFTATHSAGVAATAEALAQLLPYSKTQCTMMRIAGYLHDLGKLAIPIEILEKPAKLTPAEWNIMRRHTYYGYHILQPIADLKIINSWASLHHERIDGRGYPFHIKGNDLALGSRVMAAADIFTAISEDRPYRKAMSSKETLFVMEQLAREGALDADLVSLIKLNFNTINSVRMLAQQKAYLEYQHFSNINLRGM